MPKKNKDDITYSAETSVKATPDELKEWRSAARLANMPLRTWMRCVLDAAAGCSYLYDQINRGRTAAMLEHMANMRKYKKDKGQSEKE